MYAIEFTYLDGLKVRTPATNRVKAKELHAHYRKMARLEKGNTSGVKVRLVKV